MGTRKLRNIHSKFLYIFWRLLRKVQAINFTDSEAAQVSDDVKTASELALGAAAAEVVVGARRLILIAACRGQGEGSEW